MLREVLALLCFQSTIADDHRNKVDSCSDQLVRCIQLTDANIENYERCFTNKEKCQKANFQLASEIEQFQSQRFRFSDSYSQDMTLPILPIKSKDLVIGGTTTTITTITGGTITVLFDKLNIQFYSFQSGEDAKFVPRKLNDPNGLLLDSKLDNDS